MLDKLPGFKKRLEWFIDNRPDLTAQLACMRTPARRSGGCCRSSTQERLRRVLKVMLDENEFLSPYGIRALSRAHREQPYMLEIGGAGAPGRLRAGRVDDRPLRRQLELARADLVPGELPARRVAAAFPLLPGRRLHRGVPDRFRPV